MYIGVQPLQDIEEVNMFKDDNTVVHFKKPLSKIYYYYLVFWADVLTIVYVCVYSPVLGAREPFGRHRTP